MTRTVSLLVLALVFLFSGCQNKPKNDVVELKESQTADTQIDTLVKDVSYILAANYFVKNTVNQLDNPKIETAEKFNEIFGMATTMGKEGKPTEIDFSKQFVIALILPETDLLTTIKPISLKKNNNEITFNYSLEVGAKQTFTSRPSLAIVVDKTENGNVTLKEVK